MILLVAAIAHKEQEIVRVWIRKKVLKLFAQSSKIFHHEILNAVLYKKELSSGGPFQNDVVGRAVPEQRERYAVCDTDDGLRI